jgi:myo-inositol-1(or 4)-monophosphatase
MKPQTLQLARAAAVAAAEEAGAFLLALARERGTLDVVEKAAGDVASRADREAEALLRRRLAQAFPDHGFVGEEGGGEIGDGAPQWVVDPLDGSLNFLRGYPAWAVSVALVADGEPVVGVVHDPCRGETFSATAGAGTGRPAAAHAASLGRALVGTVFPKPASPRLPQYLAEFGRIVPAVAGVRRSGAMALELAHLSAGRLDAFWEHDMAPWDAAAGLVLLRAAGVRVVARDGAPWHRSHSLAAAAPPLLDAFVARLDGTSP